MATPLDIKLNELASAALAAHGLVLVQARLTGGSGRLTLQVLAEKSDGSGATLEQCTAAARTLSAQLDVAEIINSRYNLEVGSPGLERPLVSASDFTRFAGKHAKIRFHNPLKIPHLGQELGAIAAWIVAENEGKITVKLEKTTPEITFPYKLVREAYLSPTPEELEAYMKTAAAQSIANQQVNIKE